MESIDADLAEFLRRRAIAIPPIEMTDLSVDEARRLYSTRCAYGQDGEGQPACMVEDVRPTRSPAARIYRPMTDARRETILYVHGGGWIVGDLDTHDRMMRALCRSTRATVVAIDYRLAPESRYPVQVADCVAAFRWLRRSANALELTADAITIAGDSAGACLALSAAQCLVKLDSKPVAALMLLYGCYAPDFSTSSHHAYGNGQFGLSTLAMQRFWKYYAGDETPHRAIPLHGDLRGLPPVYLGAAAIDPLRDDTLKLAERLAAASVRYHLDIWPGCTHAFLQLPMDIPVITRAFDDIAAGWHGLLK